MHTLPSEAMTSIEQIAVSDKDPLCVECDWSVGIGGGLWTTGRQLCAHFEKNAAMYSALVDGKRVVEIGECGSRERSLAISLFPSPPRAPLQPLLQPSLISPPPPSLILAVRACVRARARSCIREWHGLGRYVSCSALRPELRANHRPRRPPRNNAAQCAAQWV